jgi:DNA-binding CsgD family transcriptional regulator
LTVLREEVSLARKMIEALDHGVIVWSRTGAVRFVTAQARAWLDEYFPSRRRTDELPAALENWLKRQSTLFGRCDDVPEPMRPLVVEREGRKLVVRPIFEGAQTILVLSEQWTNMDPKSLESMGLTRREAEVSAWMAEGKSNSEIAQILAVRPLTVKKHLERIFEKLGVENRTAAAGLVLNYHKGTKSCTG